VVGDQAWFYTGTESSPTGQVVWICTSVSSDTVHSWSKQDEVVDGNLLVTDTITSDKIKANEIEADRIKNLRGLDVESSTGTVILDVSAGGINLGRVLGAGDFAGLDLLTSANIGVYIDAAAISNAYISDLSASKLTAGIIDASEIVVTNLDAGNINAGTLNADRIALDNVTLDTQSGQLVVKTEGIDSGQLADNAVNTLKVTNNVVTEFDFDEQATYLTGTGGFRNIGTVSVSVGSEDDPADIILLWGLDQEYPSGSGPEWSYRISDGSSDYINRFGMQAQADYPASSYAVRNASSGTYTFYLGWRGSNSNIRAKGWLMALVMKKQ